MRIRDDVAFFQAVRAALAKTARGERQDRRGAGPRHPADRLAGRRRPTRSIDIFAAAGLKKPDISILSDEFLAEVRGLPQKNLAVELLRKLLERRDQGALAHATSSRRAPSPRCWRGRSARYQNRAIETAQVIEELIELAKEMREAAPARRGARPDRRRARLLRRPRGQRQRREGAGRRDAARRSPASWSRRCAATSPSTGRCARASAPRCACMVKRILRKYGYPPDKQEKATQTVLEQAELLCAEWAA